MFRPVAFFCVVTTVNIVAGSDENVNVQEFGVFCNLYQLGKTVPAAPGKQLARAEEIFAQIEGLYRYVNESENTGKQAEVIGDNALKKAVRAGALGQERVDLALKLRRITAKAERLKGQLELIHKDVKGRREAAKLHLLEALYGKGAKSVDEGEGRITSKSADVFGPDAKSGGTIVKNCGGTGAGGGNGDNVGITLVNDMVCLCYIRGSGKSGATKMCLDTVAGSTGNGNVWGTELGSIDSAWATLIEGCPKRTTRLTPSAISAALSAFRTLVGAQAKAADSSQKAARFIFGKATDPNTGCTGATAQLCVNYAYQMKKEGIPWEGKFLEAEAELNEAEKSEKTLEILLHRIEEANETAWGQIEQAVEKSERRGEARDTPTTSGNPNAVAKADDSIPDKTVVLSSFSAPSSYPKGEACGILLLSLYLA